MTSGCSNERTMIRASSWVAKRGASRSLGVGHRPALLLADEPTGNLDSVAGAEVMALLSRVHEQGRTIVWSPTSHRRGARRPGA